MADGQVARSVLLGFDGVPWELIARWTDEGHLPHFERLISEGASGPLESTIPPSPAVAWASMMTGVRADKHGIYGFQRLTGSYDLALHSSTSMRQPTLWELRSPAVVCNVPLTYPASELDGVLVSGMMAPSRNRDFAYPPTLVEEVERTVPSYVIDLDWSRYRGDESAFITDIDGMVAARRRLMRHLLDTREWSLFVCVYSSPARLQHVTWDEDVLLEHYRTLDEIIGEVMEDVADRGANLFVVSSNGYGPVSTTVNLNTLLRDAGHLVRPEEPVPPFERDVLGDGVRRLRSLVGGSTERDTTASHLSDSVDARHRDSTPPQRLAYDSSRVFAVDTYNIYVNDALRFSDGCIPASQRNAVKREVMTFLDAVVDPKTDAPLLRVYDGGDLYALDPWAPDIIVEAADGVAVRTKPAPEAVRRVEHLASSQRSKGMLLAWGPSVRKRHLSGATVFDILPTVLHSHLHPIPDNVDGRILDIFTSDSAPLTQPPTHRNHRRERGTFSEAGSDDVEDRLRSFGYLG